ncbi:hypothetical protein COOONC_28038 [Cooperia oncophora]
MQGFQKELPRSLITKYSEARLVTFADVSMEAMASCNYLCSGTSVDLLMAKGKLPSLKTLPSVTSENDYSQNGTKRIDFCYAPYKFVNPHPDGFGNSIELDCKRFASGYEPFRDHSNPAVCATRELDKTQLRDHFWWNGPRFLSNNANTWKYAYTPILMSTSHDEVEKWDDVKDTATENRVLTCIKEKFEDIFQSIRFSSFSSVKCVVAYILRFITTLIDRNISAYALTDFSTDERLYGRLIKSKRDRNAFGGCDASQTAPAFPRSSEILKSLHHLNLYEEYGIVRCRGRLGEKRSRRGSQVFHAHSPKDVAFSDDHNRLPQ